MTHERTEPLTEKPYHTKTGCAELDEKDSCAGRSDNAASALESGPDVDPNPEGVSGPWSGVLRAAGTGAAATLPGQTSAEARRRRDPDAETDRRQRRVTSPQHPSDAWPSQRMRSGATGRPNVR